MCECEVRLARIEELLARLVGELHDQRVVKNFYTIEEVAVQIGKAPYTVREHARFGRINATKRQTGRGKHCEWMVSHTELQRIRNEGLLPLAIGATVS